MDTFFKHKLLFNHRIIPHKHYLPWLRLDFNAMWQSSPDRWNYTKRATITTTKTTLNHITTYSI